MTRSAVSSPLQFAVKDQSTLRSDLARRRELKFVVPGADITKLRRAFLGSCQLLVHKSSVSTVRSLYLDTPRLWSFHAHVQGLSRRRKVRLRWYDSELPQEDMFFEIKWRKNRITGKHRVHLGVTGSLKDRPYREILRVLGEALPEAYRPALVAYDEPIIVVEYKREHFQAHDGEVRLTLDYDIRFYNQVGKRFLHTSFPRRLDGFVVVEGKVPVGWEQALRSTLYPFRARPEACSKYRTGCELLGLAPRA